MELLSRDPALRAALFRLVDVAPACAGRRDLAAHLASLLGEVERPLAPRRGARARRAGRDERRGRRRRRARRAADGEALHRRRGPGGRRAGAAQRLWASGAAASVDLLGEATVTAAEADRYARRCDEALRTLAHAARDVAGARLERDSHGSIPRVNLSRQGHRAHRARARRGAGARDRGRRAPAPRPPAHGQRGRRAPARRHGVDGLARPDHRARAQAAGRAGVPGRPVAPGSCCRPTCATPTSSSTSCSTAIARDRR